VTVVSAMDIGGSHVTAANVELASRRVLAEEISREPLDADGGAEEIVSAIARCVARLPARSASRWAIALPGPFDYLRGVGRYTGVGKFDALRDFDLRAALEPHLPGAVSVSFHHDADAFLFGEWWAGAARGHRTAVGITLGTGVGSSFLRDGQVLRHGPGIPPDGRVDLLRYAGLPLEETVSRRAIRRAYAQANGEPSLLDVREIAQRARQGDRAAAGVFTQTYTALGTVLGPLLTAIEATILVVGGSIAASWDLVAEPLRAGLAGAGPARPATVASARNLAYAPLLGAAYLAGGDSAPPPISHAQTVPG
jgi:predicted NBD/HSP70 family sugar kinase